MQQALAMIWKRVVWTTFFAAFLALEVIMSRHMASNQPVLFGIVILAAVVSAVAFVYARSNKEALLIAVLGVSVHVFCSASYWTSVIDDIAVQAEREQAAASARDVVSAKRKERYASSASGKGVAQLAAEIEALKLNDRWRASAECTKVTTELSRSFCREYFAKKADMAAAGEASSLEATVWNTTVETVDVPRNLAKGALFVATLTGMSIQAATNLLVLAFVLFTQFGLAFSLRVGYAPEKAREARTVALDQTAPLTGTKFSPPVYAPRTPLPHPAGKIAGVVAMPAAEIGSDSPNLVAAQKPLLSKDIEPKTVQEVAPPPDDGGTPAQVPDPVQEVATPVSANVVQFFKDKETPKAEWKIKTKAQKRETRKKTQVNKIHAAHGEVSGWIRAANVRVNPDVDGKSFQEVYEAYEDWCGSLGFIAKEEKAMSRQLRRLLGLPSSKDPGQRSKHGSKFWIEYDPLMIVERQALRRRA